MLASRRWRDWSPPESCEKGPEHEPPKPPKPSFVSSVSAYTGPLQELSASVRVPPYDPAEWRGLFGSWVELECLRRPRDFGGVGCLHVAFCEWAVEHNAVPCTRQTFEMLLGVSGFPVGDGMVFGLILREDIEQWQFDRV